MLAVILSGHGGFASGLEKAIEQIIGEQSQFRAIDFPPEATTPQLETAMRDAIQELDSGDGVVFMTDLLGGTPFRAASLLSQESSKVAVVTGTNLQMAAEMLLERDELSVDEFVRQALECGHRGITSLAEQLGQSDKTEEAAEDGI
ncbi:PTS sugar transporter subunit IIA [Vibrio sp. JC009]|uniref:PTS galactosamine/N-acetylgalactosamine transporter subunit IIA n=1 Tax=Vibrio sp. JC009 TaxID=2912314 RepID=UPI0023B206D2|nr:PTS galactosamine/N-acetylgalactosamine transporter subunit IIA [Vibrio sp. JC009]WED24947.1 PTS sugar transporter subunit IIA [Vibrio sp. JC009]